MGEISIEHSRTLRAGDIDIDFANRDIPLSFLKHNQAGIIKDGKLARHPSGIYVTDIPVDPIKKLAALDFRQAEQRGYHKLDFLNVSLYEQVKSEAHLIELMKEPAWEKLYDSAFCQKLIHIGNHYDTLIKFPEAVTSIEKMAMLLAAIRPAKRHLIGLPWEDVRKDIWVPDRSGLFQFKKAHSFSYAQLVVVNMNLLSSD